MIESITLCLIEMIEYCWKEKKGEAKEERI